MLNGNARNTETPKPQALQAAHDPAEQTNSQVPPLSLSSYLKDQGFSFQEPKEQSPFPQFKSISEADIRNLQQIRKQLLDDI